MDASNAKDAPNGEPKHMLYLILKSFALSTTAVLVHPIAYPISAATLLAQVNVIPEGMEVSKIVRYAFSRFKLHDVLRQGGSVVSLCQSFSQLASVAVEDLWMWLFSPTNQHIELLRFVGKTIGVAFNIATNCPLDVLKTRLVLSDLYNPNRSRVLPFTNISAKQSIALTCKKMLAEGGWRTFYSGWEIILIDAVVDHLLCIWERAEVAPGRAILSIIPIFLRALCRYAFLVMKIRANIRNDGFWKILTKIYSTKGIYGFFVGWRLFMLKIPVYIFNLFLANILFMQLKTLFNPKNLPNVCEEDRTYLDKPSPPIPRRDDRDDSSDNNNHNDYPEDHQGGHGEAPTQQHGDGNEEGRPPSDMPPKRDGWYRVNSATF